jgi:hypothetical protein
MSIALWGWNLGVMGGLLALPMTLPARRLFVEAYDESRWITGLLGRPGRGEAAGPRGVTRSCRRPGVGVWGSQRTTADAMPTRRLVAARHA